MAKYVGAQPRVSGNRLDGGTITNFASTGIDDNTTATKITVADASSTFANKILASVDSTHDIGASGTAFANLYIDDVVATTSVTVPTINVGTALLPDANDGADLGSTSKGFSDLYLADSSVLYFGNDQDVTLTHTPDTGLTLNTKLTVTGQTELNDAVAINNNAITQTGTAPLVTMKDSNGSGTAATNEVRFTDSGDVNTGGVSMVSGKTILHNNITGADGGFSIVEGTNASHADSLYIDGKKNAAATAVVTSVTNIAFSNTGTVTGGGSSFSTVSYGDVIEVSGATNAANNKEMRVISKAGDVLTVRTADGTSLTTETAGATVTITKGNQRVITVPNTVDMNVFTAEQSENSQKIASTMYVRTAISNLLDSSPAALDTLNELAAAIGDDANFGATVTTSLATKLNRDFDNLTATGQEALYDEVGVFATGGTMTFPGAGNTIAIAHNDAANAFDLTVALNDPTLGVTLTGAVTGSGTATMTDLQDATITFATTLGAASVSSSNLVTANGLANIITGLTRITSIQAADDLIVADSDDGFALKKIARSIVAPSAMSEDLGFFALAMS